MKKKNLTIIKNTLAIVANFAEKHTLAKKFMTGLFIICLLTLARLVCNIYNITTDGYSFKWLSFLISSIIYLHFNGKLTVKNLAFSILLKHIGLSSWLFTSDILSTKPLNIIPEQVVQGEAGVRRYGKFGVVVPDTQPWRIEAGHWFSGVNWGVPENLRYVNRDHPNIRANVYYLAFAHYTNEERSGVINSIRSKLMQGRNDFTEKEIGCIKFICKNNIGFIHFGGGANEDPIIRGINPNNIIGMVGQEATRNRLIQKLTIENSNILTEVARIRRDTGFNNILNK